MKQLGFFDLPDHLKRLSEAGDPLEEMARVIDFEAFRPLLESALNYSDGSKGGGRRMTRWRCTRFASPAGARC